MPAVQTTDREILRLAVPAFLALVAEPLFLLADAAVVGHLGVSELAGLGVAAVVLQTAVGLCVFLAYGTTASVARLLGAGDQRRALAQGVDGLWLAVLVGAALTVPGVLAAGPLVRALGARGDVAADGTTYLAVASVGVIPLLVVLAATGVLRGLQDTRTPLVVAAVGFGANIVLNVALVHGPGPLPALGIAGSALGTVVAQLGMAAALVVVVVRGARRAGAPLRPDARGIRAAGRAGVPLLVRTLTLRAAFLATTYAVAAGAAPDDQARDVATHQLALTLWTFLAFALDALAIAAQALVGRSLGAGDVPGTRRLVGRMVRWGAGAGVVTGLLLAAASPVLGRLFTPDPDVQRALVPVLLVAAAGQPLAGVVFVLDGVLMGAGDGTYLAAASTAVLVLYAPVVLVAGLAGAGLVAVWASLAFVLMGGRWASLVARARTERWMVTGARA